MKIIIETITEWEKDDAEIEGDRCHGGSSESDILMQLATETREKKESEWTVGLPYAYVVHVDVDVDAAFKPADCIQDAFDKALSAYRSEHCDGDYLVPTGFEGKVIA